MIVSVLSVTGVLSAFGLFYLFRVVFMLARGKGILRSFF